MSTQHQTDSAVAEEVKVEEPRKFAVVLLNDHYSTMDFVIEVLTRFFKHTYDQALKITLNVHHQGRGIAGVYTFEIAETKAFQVNEYSRAKGHPLKTIIEPVEESL
jgi:ATP-dependent Clp protease adaptor protein ClpS